MAKKYMGEDEYPLRQPGEQRVIIRVEPEHVHGGEAERSRPASSGRRTALRRYTRRSSRRHSDGRRGWVRSHSSRSTSCPRARAASTHSVCACRRRRVSPSGAISMCSLSAGR